MFAYRVGQPAERLVAIPFSDVTERRAGDARLRASEADLRRADVLRVALADFSKRIRDQSDPATISSIAGGIVGATLREVASRVRTTAERARSDKALRDLNERLEEEVAVRTRERDRLWSTTPA